MQNYPNFFCLFPNKSLSLHHHLLTILKSIIMEQKEEKKRLADEQADKALGGAGRLERFPQNPTTTTL